MTSIRAFCRVSLAWHAHGAYINCNTAALVVHSRDISTVAKAGMLIRREPPYTLFLQHTEPRSSTKIRNNALDSSVPVNL